MISSTTLSKLLQLKQLIESGKYPSNRQLAQISTLFHSREIQNCFDIGETSQSFYVHFKQVLDSFFVLLEKLNQDNVIQQSLYFVHANGEQSDLEEHLNWIGGVLVLYLEPDEESCLAAFGKLVDTLVGLFDIDKLAPENPKPSVTESELATRAKEAEFVEAPTQSASKSLPVEIEGTDKKFYIPTTQYYSESSSEASEPPSVKSYHPPTAVAENLLDLIHKLNSRPVLVNMATSLLIRIEKYLVDEGQDRLHTVFADIKSLISRCAGGFSFVVLDQSCQRLFKSLKSIPQFQQLYYSWSRSVRSVLGIESHGQPIKRMLQLTMDLVLFLKNMAEPNYDDLNHVLHQTYMLVNRFKVCRQSDELRLNFQTWKHDFVNYEFSMINKVVQLA